MMILLVGEISNQGPRINVGHVQDRNAGGMFQYAQSLLDGLSSLPAGDYKVEVACASHAWVPILKDSPFSVTWLKQGKLGLHLANAMMAARIPGALTRSFSTVFNPIVSQLKYLHCDFWIFPAQDAIAYQLPLPAVVAIHDLMHRYEGRFPEVGGGYRYYVREHRMRNIAVWAKGVLVDSKLGRNQVVKSYGIDPEKIYPLPYIPPRFIYQSSEDEHFESRYALPAKFLFYPAQFWPHKNHNRLVSAAASIRTKCPDIHLVFSGGKSHSYEQIRAHARSLGMLDRIRFLGYVPDADMPGLYRCARAMVMPTFLGPTNIPPLEALVCDCPVAVSNIYAMPEQLGDAALYFDPRSIPDMAATLERLWLDDMLCNHLRERGRAKTASWGQKHFNNRLEKILSLVMNVTEPTRPWPAQ